jgi:ceramide glucosyltransferase
MEQIIILSLLCLIFLAIFCQVFLIIRYRNDGLADTIAVARYPKVSILKPISNIDDGMEKNIETFYTLDYPDYELIFGINTTQSSKCTHEQIESLIRSVQAKHPNIKTQILRVTFDKVVNPKVTVLMNLEKQCAGELFWVTDSNVRVEPETLKKLAHEYVTRGSKIVFSPIRGTGTASLGSALENAYLNSFVSANVIWAWSFFKRQIIVGKSMLIEKKALDDFGGFGFFKDYLAEDFIMGEFYVAKKVPISTNYTWVTNFISTASVSKFWSRVERWAKIRYNVNRFQYMFEPLLNPVALALLCLPFMGRAGLSLLGGAVCLKVLLEYAIFFAVNTEDRKKPWVILLYPFFVVLKDLLLLAMFPVPILSSKVVWRGRKIVITKNTKILEVA